MNIPSPAERAHILWMSFLGYSELMCEKIVFVPDTSFALDLYATDMLVEPAYGIVKHTILCTAGLYTVGHKNVPLYWAITPTV